MAFNIKLKSCPGQWLFRHVADAGFFSTAALECAPATSREEVVCGATELSAWCSVPANGSLALLSGAALAQRPELLLSGQHPFLEMAAWAGQG